MTDTHLISHRNKNRTQKQIRVKCKLWLYLYIISAQQIPCELDQNRNCNHKIITIGLNEVVTRDRGRINVVFTKWTKEILKEKH